MVDLDDTPRTVGNPLLTLLDAECLVAKVNISNTLTVSGKFLRDKANILVPGIVSAIGSSENYKIVLENPDEISRTVLSKGLDSGTAYAILSIDIADVDVGNNVGADLETDQAEADKKVAQAKAESRRAMAVAAEQEMKARVQEMRSKVIEAEAEVPKAMAQAFRDGNLGIMDYYRMQNIQSDTDMRQSISDIEEEKNEKGNNPDELSKQIPITNPFLKELMESFLSAGGRKGKSGAGVGIDFDELGINEVVDLLDHSNMEAVVRDFGDKNPLEDPVIHFYERFLHEYDSEVRMQRGVFYTPRPVVSFIVRRSA